MPTMKDTHTLRDGPNGQQTGAIALFGEEVQPLGQESELPLGQGGKWTNVQLIGNGPGPKGWVPTEAIDPTGSSAIAPGPIDKTQFAKECWLEAIYFGSNAHFLAIVAELRSGTQDGANGAGLGPYRFTQAEWDASSSDSGYDIEFAPQNINNWRLQCVVAALIAQHARQALETANPGQAPTAIALYNEWLKQVGEAPPADQAQLATDMQKAIDATTKPYTDAGNSLIEATPAPPIKAPDAPAASGPTPPLPGSASVKTVLDFIGHAEAPLGYNQMVGETKTTAHNLTAMTIDAVMVLQQQFISAHKASSAAGHYQIIRGTLAGLKTSLQLTGKELFDGPCQDRLATKLLVDRGLNKRLAGTISKETFASHVAMEWASMPVVVAMVGSCGFMLSPKQSYYDGVGQNHALVSVQDFLAAIP